MSAAPAPEQQVGTELTLSARELTDRIGSAPIATLGDCEQAVIDRQLIGDLIKRGGEYFDPLVQSAHHTWRMLCDRRNEFLHPLQRRDDERRQAIGDFKIARDRERQAHEREIAEQQRREREAQATAEAAALETAGDPDMAAAVIDAAVIEPAPVVVLPDEMKTIPDLTFRRRWCWRWRNGPADIKQTPPQVLAAALAQLPAAFLMPDEKKIGAFVRSMKGSAAIPGVDVYYVDDPIR